MSNHLSRRIKLRRRPKTPLTPEPTQSSQERALQVWEGEGGELRATRPAVVRTVQDGRQSM